MTDHYDGPGNTPSWTSYTSGEWARAIFGIGGSMAAIQENSETPVLQIADLHGDLVGTVADSETATKLSKTEDTTEYGVPTTSEPPKYSWLGAGEFPTELPSGVVAMGARSYVPEIGRFLQPDPIPGGSPNAYAYTFGDPLNEADPSGEWALKQTSGGLSAVGTGEGTMVSGGTFIAEGAIMPAPVNVQLEEEYEAAEAAEEYEEYEEEWEEEGGYVSYHPEQQGIDSESAVIYQPLEEGTDTGDSDKSVGGSQIMIVSTCPSTGDPCWKDRHHDGGKPSKGGGSRCRSGGPVVNGKCQPNKKQGSNGCEEVMGTVGSIVGGGLGGMATGGAGGQLVGGGEAGVQACRL